MTIKAKIKNPYQDIAEAVNFEVLENLKMDESDIVTQYLSGNLKGIYIDENCYYMPIRITGTGQTTRNYTADDGYVGNFNIDRLKYVFMTDRFIEQCGRIPVLLDHPFYDGYNLMTYNAPQSLKHIIGNTIKAYKKENEIWAIAKIFDLNLLTLISEGKIRSTSPAVNSSMPRREYDGLYEEQPIEINHIAFVERGYWDRVSDEAFDVSHITIRDEALENFSKNTIQLLKNL